MQPELQVAMGCIMFNCCNTCLSGASSTACLAPHLQCLHAVICWAGMPQHAGPTAEGSHSTAGPFKAISSIILLTSAVVQAWTG